MRATIRLVPLLLLLLLAAVSFASTASASPNRCEPVTSLTTVCVFSGTYSFGEGCAQSQVGVVVFAPLGTRGVWVDNGCYQGSSEWGPYEGSFVGASVDDGQPGDGFRRIHLHTGTGATPNGEEDYCHVGIFNEQYQYTRLLDCPAVFRVPSVLPTALGLPP